MRLSVIVASGGRPSLVDTLSSIASQLQPGDELLVDVNDDAPWGHAARNRTMERAQGDALLFIDDDDRYLPGALNVVRQALHRHARRIHVFRMRYTDPREDLWTEPVLECGNVSTQMFCVPNLPGRLGEWGDRYEGDWDFIAGTAELQGAPLFHEDVIVEYGLPWQRHGVTARPLGD